ncbi:unnamed protein product [Bubo scandiacus]
MRKIRKYAQPLLSIAEFPLSSTGYVLKKLFYNIDLVEQLLFQLVLEKSMQTILKTPLFMVSLAAYWPSFDFTECDLSEAGVDGDEAVRLGLLSKFTAQGLHSVYKFFHPLFQEFVAGRRLSELLVSDEKEKLERGLQYLQQVNTFRKAAECYSFLLYLLDFASSNYFFQIWTNSSAWRNCQ